MGGGRREADQEVPMLQKVPRWVVIATGLALPAIAFAAANAPSVCPSWCTALFGCGG
jgi:hypothetical protein